MTDILLGDLISWPESKLRAPGGALPSDVAARAVSWAVGIRASTPALPALRGQEIVIIALDVMTELETAGGETLRQLFDLLAEQPVSGLIMDHSPAISPPEGVPLLLGDVPFPADVESHLNRLLTERRAALYNLGSSLARGLSSVALAGATLDDVLDEAERASGYALALVTARGSTIARSGGAPAFVPDEVYESKSGTSDEGGPPLIDVGGARWLTTPVSSHALPEGVRLAVLLGESRGTELVRLTASHTADALRVLFDRSRPLALDRRDERERTLRAFLTGNLAPDDSRVAAVFARLDLGAGVRLAIASGLDEPVVTDLRRDENLVPAWLDDERVIAVFPVGNEPAVLSRACQVVVSQAVADVGILPSALRSLEAFGSLVDRGLIAGSPLYLDRAADIGPAGLLLQLLDENGDGAATAAWFYGEVLDPLLNHDAERTAQLVSSLRAYLDSGGALGSAAEQLAIHRNTLAYRLSRIRELTGRDPDCPRTALEFQIALLLFDLLEANSARE